MCSFWATKYFQCPNALTRVQLCSETKRIDKITSINACKRSIIKWQRYDDIWNAKNLNTSMVK